MAEANEFYYLLQNIGDIEEVYIEKLGEIIKHNSWIKYYCNCEAEIDGWIDFEREIYPVIDLFEFVFQCDYFITRHGGSEYGEANIERRFFKHEMVRIAKLWTKYFNTSGSDVITIKEPFVSAQYGILKKKIIDELRKEFDEFVYAFEIYLHEFVYKRKDLQPLQQIKSLDIGNVISFNYTWTERLYGVEEDSVHHIHGAIREDLEINKNQMVVGVNEREKQNMSFLYFVKYFQRIQKKSGVRYKEFISNKTENIYGRITKEEYTLYIYGHSLDETDEDILKYVIGNVNEKGELKLNPKQVVIFYYNTEDFEQKVFNLIKLYGRSIVEEYMEKELFQFLSTSEK